MQIDRSNYEIWIIDWLDGKLNDEQSKQVSLFLSENPDLSEEFEDLAFLRLKPSAGGFYSKEILKKSLVELSDPQFEMLCIAYLENDLSANQQAELIEMVGHNRERKRTFELIQRLKLTPSEAIFKNKNKLIVRTLHWKVVRLSTIGISVAAAVVLLIILFSPVPQRLFEPAISTVQKIAPDSAGSLASGNGRIEGTKSLNTTTRYKKQVQILPVVSEKNSIITLATHQRDTVPDDPAVIKIRNQQPEIVKISIPVSQIELLGSVESNKLTTLTLTVEKMPVNDGTSNIERFLTKAFRRNLLDKDISSDIPLKGYEIAEAGVNGLNKLLGWQMALEKNNDVNGEISYVSFSSKMLKFNAPVKKNSVPR